MRKSQEHKKPSVLITGPLPPPAGGISIHIHRMHHLLKDDFHFNFIDESFNKKADYFNIRSMNIFRYLKMVMDADVMFIHSGNRFFKKLHIITGKLLGKKMLMTIHGYGLKRNFPFRQFDSLIYSLPQRIILVNEDILTRINLPAEKCIIKHAFLPPILEEEPMLPEEINECIKKARTGNKTIIVANASRLNTHNNEDLYGLDQCVELAKRLKDKNIEASFIFTVSSLDQGTERYQYAERFITEHNLHDCFLLLNMEISFVRLIEKCDIVLRPTNTDGDALTIREGLHYGKIVLASDIVERPEGTCLFATRNIDDLENKITELIKKNKNNTTTETKITSTQNPNYHDFYKDILEEMMN